MCLVAQSSLTVCNPMNCSPPNSSLHEDSPGKNTEVGCYALLQGTFPTQGSNPGVPHCKEIIHCLSYQGSPRVLAWGAYHFSRDLPNPGIKLGSPALQVDSLPAESPGNPKNTGVGGLSLLWWIFPTQESNWGLLHCRRILYQLSYQGSLLSLCESCSVVSDSL